QVSRRPRHAWTPTTPFSRSSPPVSGPLLSPSSSPWMRVTSPGAAQAVVPVLHEQVPGQQAAGPLAAAGARLAAGQVEAVLRELARPGAAQPVARASVPLVPSVRRLRVQAEQPARAGPRRCTRRLRPVVA